MYNKQSQCSKRERERERERERQTDRQTERKRQRTRERERVDMFIANLAMFEKDSRVTG